MTPEKAKSLIKREVYTYDTHFKILKVIVDRPFENEYKYMWVYPSILKRLDDIDETEYPEEVSNLFETLDEVKEVLLGFIEEKIETLFKTKEYIKELTNF